LITHLPAFLGVAALVIVAPGPDTALTIRNTLRGGRRSGVLTGVGVVGGQTAWAIATAAGLAALVRASEPAFLALEVAGAGYLVFLGGQALRAAFRGGEPALYGVDGARVEPRRAFRQGLISNVTNPKMAAFFTSLLPQFAGGDHASFAALLVLALIFSSMTLVWLTGYVFVVAKAGDVFRRPRIRRTLEGATGIALVALGLRLATERR
jgi:threonine/homoserine/homoserine lactone efflux protein